RSLSASMTSSRRRISPTCSASGSRVSSPGSAGGRSKGLRWCEDVLDKRIYWPPTASHTLRYSSSGSMMMKSTPASRLRSAMSLVKYDLPAPDLANTTAFAFSRELSNGSKMTGEWLCRAMPYSTPLSIESVEDENGNVVASELVSRLRVTSSWSKPCGWQERSPESCSKMHTRDSASM